MFFPSIMKVFECFHYKVKDIFHYCVSMAWLIKGTKWLPLLVLHIFYR
jgi:hypothetical protein